MTDTLLAINDPAQNRIGQSLQAIFQLIPTLFRRFDQVRLVIEMFETRVFQALALSGSTARRHYISSSGLRAFVLSSRTTCV